MNNGVAAIASIGYVIRFVWLVDDEAVFEYGPAADSKFFSINRSHWEMLGEPRTILLSARAM